MQRLCDFCGQPYEAKRPASRFCKPLCRKRASRIPDLPAVLPVEQIEPAAGLLVEITTQQLIAAGRLDTVLGRQALELAARMSARHETGAAVASLSREFRAVMVEALDGMAAKRDPMDELASRRDLKAAGA